MPTMKTVKKEAAERRALAKQFLQQRSAMLRMNLTPVEYLCFRLGVGPRYRLYSVRRS